MARRKNPEDLSVDELRRLLLDKRRTSRKERLDQFRRTGRIVQIAPDISDTTLEKMQSSPVIETSNRDADLESSTPPRSKRRRWADRVLFMVEVLAIVGLGAVMFNGLNLIRFLNTEVAAMQVQPTLTPTPLVMAVVLPSGHVPPDAQGRTRPNDAEIPEHLRPMVQSIANLPIPTAGPEQATRIQIAAINVDAPVVQGDGWEQLKKGVGKNITSVNPGRTGNLILSAHNDVYGEIFRDLDQLQSGDQIVVFTQARQYIYVVTRTVIVEPTQVEVMAQTSDATVTLISCYPYLKNDKRIVVFAKLQNP